MHNARKQPMICSRIEGTRDRAHQLYHHLSSDAVIECLARRTDFTSSSKGLVLSHRSKTGSLQLRSWQ